MKPGDTRVIDGVTYACVPTAAGRTARQRARQVIGSGSICGQCPYNNEDECSANFVPCAGAGDNTIVRLETAAVLALEGLTA
jgi:hypothetical protein